MLIVFTESVLLYHFKGFILEIKTRQYKKKEVRVVLLHWRPNSGPESNFERSLPQPVNVISYCVSP